MTEQPTQPQPQQVTTAPDRPSPFMIGVGVALVLILLLTAWQALMFRGYVNEQREVQCTSLQYEYDSEAEDGDGGFVKQEFSELDPQSRAQADVLDCDVEGR